MSITVYDDVIVPDCVFTPSSGGSATRKNDRTVNQGGYATVNVVRDVTLRTYELPLVPMEIDAWQAIVALWEVTDAGAFGMLLKDPVDSVVLDTEGVMQGMMSGVEFGSLGFGNGTPNYMLAKAYKPASSTRRRKRPVTRLNGTPQLFRAGSPVTIGAGAGNASLSAGPTSVTFVADASQNVTAVTVGATTQVTLASAIAGFAIGGRLWLQDLTGADAALLNSKSHQITNIAGAVYTLNTNTAGKTITPAGTGKKYPQPTESLYWAGNYYVPVQFAADNLDWDLVLGGNYEDRLVTAPTVSLVEIREA